MAKRGTLPPSQVEAITAIVNDLRDGRSLWGPILKVGGGEIREPNRDYVRPIQRSTIRRMLDAGLIEDHPDGHHRYVLTERGVKFH